MWEENTIENEIQRNSLEYGIAVNTDRSIPDATSGLKPVARRILWDCFIEGRTNAKPHVKNARIVGDVMGRLHPHGDSSIYGALIRLATPWIMRYPLIDVHGSVGNILGDGPAAMRYTEGRLAKLTEDGMLEGLKKRNVDFIPTYDETEEEPITLPASFPNLLCNPNEGIGWALASSWAPHNLNEVSLAINDYLDGKEPMIPGPDFPTAGIVINKNDIPMIMKTGKGTVKIRGRYKVEKQNIVFYEIPYGTRVDALMQELGTAADEGDILNIKDIRNETSEKNGLRLVIEVEKGVEPETVVPIIFAKTDLQSTFSYNQVALVDGVPTELNLENAIKVYVDHNISCILKETKFDLDKALARLEIVHGLLKALASIDEIIKLIKASESAAKAKDELISRYDFTENQAKAILDMKLSRLAKLEGIELENEKADLEAKVIDLKDILATKERQIDILKSRLAEIVKKYGDARKTELIQLDIPTTKSEKIIAEVVPEDCVVVTTKSGLIKRVPTSAFKVQKRGTKGVKSEDDALLDVIKTNTVDTMMFFTDGGKMYRCVVNTIPVGTNTTKGIAISELIKCGSEKIIAVSSLHRKSIPKYVVFITKNGLIKKTPLEEYIKTNRNTGIQAINIKDGDSIVDILFQDDEDLILITKNGMSIRFKSTDVSIMGRVAAGVKGITLGKEDEVVAAMSVHKDSDQVAVFASNGLGKKTNLTEYPVQARGGKGTMTYKLSDGVHIAAATMLADEDIILISGSKNSVCISAKDVPNCGKVTIGNILIKGNIIAATKI